MQRQGLKPAIGIVVGALKSGNGEMALQLFAPLGDEGYKPDRVSVLGALKACSSLIEKDSGQALDGQRVVFLERSREIHRKAVKLGLDSDLFVASTLIDLYAKCGSLTEARRVFEGMSHRSVVTWNCMILGSIAQVFDGEFGNDYRRKILPSYKAGRRKFKPLDPSFKWTRGLEASFSRFQCFLRRMSSIFHFGRRRYDTSSASYRQEFENRQEFESSLASPDKDFKQLVSENVELLIPFADLRRWSFHTVKDYVEQHKREPGIELGLRCLLGDAADGGPGVPGFGRKTALKLMRKHGSLENILSAAAIRAVGKPYIQDALKEHSVLLEKNMEVLSLRRDINVELPVEWCRDKSNDLAALQWLEKELEMLHRV
ncbi:uncharacterized protein LOC9640151 [Selaginella moellendorffii]|uniref:uncharacterized protein LOC9640151 n=1 Tax=Selaginella moellendorffii TaxID=88036 RepID=UPI000D1CB507|nr:uncharacterized protein LOC9640151 [Selaginella moellendorffii]|eukprot:XP_024515520.1 uncharacterized protein LOC9640151 [Selaginella moellendorffii]